MATSVPKVTELLGEINEIHKWVHDNIEAKASADESRKFQSFDVGEFVMVHLQRGRFPQGSYSKLKNRNFGPCQILKKISNNAYVIDLPEEFQMSNIFIVADLRKYHPPTDNDMTHSWMNILEEGATDGGMHNSSFHIHGFDNNELALKMDLGPRFCMGIVLGVVLSNFPLNSTSRLTTT